MIVSSSFSPWVCMWLQIPNEGSLVLVVALIVLQGVTGIAFGLVISAAIDDEQSANQAALGVFYPNLVISGVTVWLLYMCSHFLSFFLHI